MKIVYKNLLFLALVFSLSSCEDFFEATLEIDPPEHTEQLVIQAFGSTDKNTLNVLVSKSVGILEDVSKEDQRIDDAIVKLIHNGTSHELVYQNPQTQNQGQPYNYVLEEGVINLEAEQTYILEVEANGFDKATSTCVVPRVVLPTNFEFKAEGPTIFEDEYSKVSMIIPDPEGEGDHYEFSLSQGNEFNNEIYFDGIYTESLDPLVEETFQSLFLKDESFDGEDKILDLLMNRFYVQNEPDIEDYIYVNWRTVTPAHYKYNKSFDDHQENSDNPFSTPVQVFSNIENGIGIFTIYNEHRVKIN